MKQYEVTITTGHMGYELKYIIDDAESKEEAQEFALGMANNDLRDMLMKIKVAKIIEEE